MGLQHHRCRFDGCLCHPCGCARQGAQWHRAPASASVQRSYLLAPAHILDCVPRQNNPRHIGSTQVHGTNPYTLCLGTDNKPIQVSRLPLCGRAMGITMQWYPATRDSNSAKIMNAGVGSSWKAGSTPR